MHKFHLYHHFNCLLLLLFLAFFTKLAETYNHLNGLGPDEDPFVPNPNSVVQDFPVRYNGAGLSITAKTPSYFSRRRPYKLANPAATLVGADSILQVVPSNSSPPLKHSASSSLSSTTIQIYSSKTKPDKVSEQRHAHFHAAWRLAQQSAVDLSEYFIPLRSMINILNISSQDFGVYTCAMQNPLGSDEASTTLEELCQSFSILITISHLFSVLLA
ncbi:unnamed protein product [Protopolystoma xenopodis]|uniref:Ig-like domain-containing protein n=1 Tax=Protopolystoma xenopodis TaxID=117903 RepID=A0A3S5FE74_9PLAT|nr:unnamed protein product [Protopolystoma xenopodis]